MNENDKAHKIQLDLSIADSREENDNIMDLLDIVMGSESKNPGTIDLNRAVESVWCSAKINLKVLYHLVSINAEVGRGESNSLKLDTHTKYREVLQLFIAHVETLGFVTSQRDKDELRRAIDKIIGHAECNEQ